MIKSSPKRNLKPKIHTKYPHGTPRQIHLSDLIKAGILSVGDELVDDDNSWTVTINSEDGKIKAHESIFSLQSYTNRVLSHWNTLSPSWSKHYGKDWVSFWEVWNLKKWDEVETYKFHLTPLLELKKKYEQLIATQKSASDMGTGVALHKTKNGTSKKERYERIRYISELIAPAKKKPLMKWVAYNSKIDVQNEKPLFEKPLDLVNKDLYNQFREVERGSRKYYKAAILYKDEPTDESWGEFWTNRAYLIRPNNSKNSIVAWWSTHYLAEWIKSQSDPLIAAQISLRTIDGCRYHEGDPDFHDGFDYVHIWPIDEDWIKRAKTYLAENKIEIVEQGKDGDGFSIFINYKESKPFDAKRKLDELCIKINKINWARFEFGEKDFHNGLSYVEIKPYDLPTIKEVKQLLEKYEMKIVEEFEDEHENKYLIFFQAIQPENK